MYMVDNLYISLLPPATTIWSSFNYLSKSASWNTWSGSWPEISVQGTWQYTTPPYTILLLWMYGLKILICLPAMVILSSKRFGLNS